MGIFSKQSFLGQEGPFTENYKFYVDSKKKLKIKLEDHPDLSHNGALIKAYCRNENGNFYIGKRSDYNLSLILDDNRYKKNRSFIKITEDVVIISVTFEMYKKYKKK